MQYAEIIRQKVYKTENQAKLYSGKKQRDPVWEEVIRPCLRDGPASCRNVFLQVFADVPAKRFFLVLHFIQKAQLFFGNTGTTSQ